MNEYAMVFTAVSQKRKVFVYFADKNGCKKVGDVPCSEGNYINVQAMGETESLFSFFVSQKIHSDGWNLMGGVAISPDGQMYQSLVK